MTSQALPLGGASVLRGSDVHVGSRWTQVASAEDTDNKLTVLLCAL